MPALHSQVDLRRMWGTAFAVISGSPFVHWRSRQLLVGANTVTAVLRLHAEVPLQWLQAECLLQALPSLSPSHMPLQCLRAEGQDPFTIFLCFSFRSARALTAALTTDILFFLDSPVPIHVLPTNDLWKLRTVPPSLAACPT